jgi:hypothetical protein
LLAPVQPPQQVPVVQLQPPLVQLQPQPQPAFVIPMPNGPIFADDESNRRFQKADKDFQNEISDVESGIKTRTQTNISAMQECLTSSELLQGRVTSIFYLDDQYSMRGP